MLPHGISDHPAKCFIKCVPRGGSIWSLGPSSSIYSLGKPVGLTNVENRHLVSQKGGSIILFQKIIKKELTEVVPKF